MKGTLVDKENVNKRIMPIQSFLGKNLCYGIHIYSETSTMNVKQYLEDIMNAL